MVTAMLVPSTAATAAADPFLDARQRWLVELTGGTNFNPAAAPYAAAVARITATAQQHWDTINAAPTTDLWADLTSASVAADRHETFIRVKEMALAYRTHGSSLGGNPALLTVILRALDWLGANRYNMSSKNDGNTWYWALGIPMELNDTMVMLFDEMGVARRTAFTNAEAKFLPGVYTTGAYATGANRAWSAYVIALRGVILSNATLTEQASAGLIPVMRYVTTSDGFYERGGFIQHTTFPYVGGYGNSALELSAEIMYLFDGSPWDITDPAVDNLQKSVRTTFAPFIWNGVMMETVRGREISREYNQDRDAGSAAIRAIALLADSAASTTARAQLQGTVKRMLQESDLAALQASSSIAALSRSQAILTAASVTPVESPLGAVTFSSMDRFVHRTNAYAFAVSTSSSRIKNFETAGSGENQNAWYTADGMTFLYLDDTAPYTGNFWANVNRYRLPGTTVDTRVKGANDGSDYRSPSSFSGGVASVAGSYGAYGMMLDGAQSNLVANKAWFTFDDEIVALGSGINDPGLSGVGWDGQPQHVESIVEDRRMEPAGQSLVVDGVPMTSADPVWLTNPGWAQIAGSRGQIGYVFPGSESLRAAKTTNAGSWFDVNAKNGSTTPRTDTYFSLWVDHGAAPSNATYSYVLLPNSTTAQTRAYAAAPETTVLANTATVAAVKETTKNAVGAIFWKLAPSTVSVGGAPFLTSSTRSAVSTSETAVSLAVSVADPTQAAKSKITITIARNAKRVMSASAGVTVKQLSPQIVLDVSTVGTRGAAETVKFGY